MRSYIAIDFHLLESSRSFTGPTAELDGENILGIQVNVLAI